MNHLTLILSIITFTCSTGFAETWTAVQVGSHLELKSRSGQSRMPTVAEYTGFFESLAETGSLDSFAYTKLKAANLERARRELIQGNPDREARLMFGSGPSDQLQLGQALATYINQREAETVNLGANTDVKKWLSMRYVKPLCAPKDPDLQTLYDALSEIVSDKRCNINSVAATEGPSLDNAILCSRARIKTSQVGIKIGEIDVYADGGQTTNKLRFAAIPNHSMTKEDWLNGSKSAPGLRTQLLSKNLCTSHPVRTNRPPAGTNSTR